MSSNNQVIILKNNKHRKKPFEVHENMCVDNDFKPSGKTIISRHESLIKAIKEAKAYCNVYPYVEYGFTINDSALEETKLNKLNRA